MDETTIKINLVGVNILLPDTNVSIYAKMEQTWIQVLNDLLGLQLNSNSGVFVATFDYNPLTPVSGQGGRGDITETVKEFVSKFKCTNDCFILLWESKYFPSPPMISVGQQTTSSETTPNSTPASGTSSALARGPKIVSSPQDDHVVPQLAEGTSGPSTVLKSKSQRQHCSKRLKRKGNQSRTVFVEKQPKRKAAVFALQKNKVESAEKDKTEEIETKSKSDYVTEQSNENTAVAEVGADFDDDLSLQEAATQERNELVGMGTEIEITNELVLARAERFSNAFLLRVKNEIKNLQQSGGWDRFLNRSPLARNLLQELFKD